MTTTPAGTPEPARSEIKRPERDFDWNDMMDVFMEMDRERRELEGLDELDSQEIERDVDGRLEDNSFHTGRGFEEMERHEERGR